MKQQMSQMFLIVSFAGLVLVSTAPMQSAIRNPQFITSNPARFVGIHDLRNWTKEPASGPGEEILVSPEVDPKIDWDQLVVSWNAETPGNSGIRVEARGVYPDRATAWYTMGLWSQAADAVPFAKGAPASNPPRESVAGQHDSDGSVQTDTLVVTEPCRKAQVRVTLIRSTTTKAPLPPQIRFVGLAFLDSRVKPEQRPPNRRAWGKTMEVPERAQGSYEHGAVICSPTCTSMVLSYWAGALKNPALDNDVPEVVQGVYDRVYDGTGNWPFNTAYAGSLPGMRAYVARFGDVRELEDWIAAGIPVVCSVSYTALRGVNRPDPSGHLVVCVGFTETGDVVLNDPALNPKRGLRVRTPYPRDRFIAGWADSHNTVYLIYPEKAHVPKDELAHWFVR